MMDGCKRCLFLFSLDLVSRVVPFYVPLSCAEILQFIFLLLADVVSDTGIFPFTRRHNGWSTLPCPPP